MSDTATVEETQASDSPGLLSQTPVEEAAEKSDPPSHLATDPDAPTEVQPVQEAPQAERPEQIPEQFWDADKGEIKVESVLESYKELRAKMDTGKHKAPENGKYDFENFTKEMKEDEQQEFNNDPLLQGFLEVAKEEGLSQAAVEKTVGLVHIARKDAQEQAAENKKTEIERLGHNGDKVIASVNAWLTKFQTSKVITADELAALGRFSDSAELVTGLNKIMRSSYEPGIPPVQSTEMPTTRIQDIQALIEDPRYGKDTPAGIAYTKDVERQAEEYAKAVEG